MATKTWVGTDAGNEGDWATAANWSGSGVPADGDTVNILSGSQGVVEGFAQQAITLAKLNIGGTLAGCDIGAPGTPLVIGATAVAIQTKNTVGVYLSGATGSDDPLAKVVIECQDADAVVNLAGDLTTVILRKGNLTIAGTVASLIVEPLNGDSSNCSFDVQNATVTSLINDGGVGSIDHASAVVTTYKGFGASITTMDEGTATNIETSGTAKFIHNAPTTTAAIVQYGSSDVNTSEDLRPKTVTAWNKARKASSSVGNNVTLTGTTIKDLAGDAILSQSPMYPGSTP